VADVTQLLPLVDAVKATRSPFARHGGRPRQRPRRLYADRAYHSRRHRAELRRRGIEPHIVPRGLGGKVPLGRYRWKVERTVAWTHAHRRLRVRYDRRADIHEAFLTLSCIMICWRQIKRLC
jgi:IS5 family transposase